MASIGKKILSAFIDIEADKQPENEVSISSLPNHKNNGQVQNDTLTGSNYAELNEKFSNYFEQLLKESNLPGPDYFEFMKMVEAMQSIPDEKTRYLSAFAGLSVQGLDKNKLMSSAEEYIKLLDEDATHFNATINATLSEKVERKKQALEDQLKRIQVLTNEITELNNSIITLGNEINENEQKIHNNLDGYAAELQKFKARIAGDIKKINSLI